MAWSYIQVEQRPASKNSVATNNERTEGCCVMMGHSSGESKTEGTEGCCVIMGHSRKGSPRQRELKAAVLTRGSKGSPRQRELKAAVLSWGTAAREAQDRGN